MTKGRPEKIKKLNEAFAIDASIKNACAYAGITTQTYYTWIKEIPNLSDEFDSMRAQLPLKSHQIIATRLHSNDVDLAKWYLERRVPEQFSPQSKIQHTGAIPVTDGETNQEDQEAIEKFHQNLKDNMLKRSMEKARVDGEIP